ncbi:PREDICTED: growth-regulated protein homolog beta-like [Galeopterus variegatus]|uniref:Growth-regulated protein homolog beta-like n=1 Tax=Galeopterus variegatus TaxID=482537 RepID=A0ABM0RR70_GALVR|nr:PREDICTED: growth-regulated protein homolog beta-like [Galeopterus variegatus]
MAWSSKNFPRLGHLEALQGVHLKNIQSVKVTSPGPHCDQTEVIATLKNGQEACLNPTAPMVKKIIDKMLKKVSGEEQGVCSDTALSTNVGSTTD